MARTDTGIRVELALRAAKVGKSALAMIEMSPTMAKLQMIQLVEEIRELDSFLKAQPRD